MVQLAPGHDVYIDKRQLDKAIEASKINETSLDGCRLARRLLSIMFLPQQRMFGSLSEHPAPGLTQLDPTITNAIIGTSISTVCLNSYLFCLSGLLLAISYKP